MNVVNLEHGLVTGVRRQHTQVRILVVLVKRRPKEGPDDARPLDGAEGQVHPPHHGLVLLVRECDDVGREGLVLLGVLLQASVRPSLVLFLAHGNEELMGPGSEIGSYMRRRPLVSVTPSGRRGGAKAPCLDVSSRAWTGYAM